MSKLEELINKLCPNGVEFKKLIEITTWDKKFNGIDNSYKKIFKHISAEQLKKFNSDSGSIKLLSTGIFDGYAEEEKCKEFINKGDVVTLPSGGTANIKYFSGKFLDSGNIIAITRDEKKYNIKYIYYNLINIQSLIQSFYRGSGVKHPDMANILNISIPVPPLEVQCEIVRILDNFTLLSAELSAELSARQKQYEYYSKELFNFNDYVEFISLESIADIGTGSSNTNEAVEDGQYPFYVRSQQVYYKNNYEYDDNSIITSGDGVGVGKIFHYTDGKYALHQRAYRINITNNKVNSKYFYYYMKSTFYDYIQKNAFNSSVTSIRRPMLNKYPVPILSLEKQNKIVNILEKFEKLCNDISEGLPAEIEARKKQYEYYRDKLLTFKELK